MRGTTKDHPALRLQHGGRWTIALLVSFDAASDSSNKAGTMNAAQANHYAAAPSSLRKKVLYTVNPKGTM